VWEKPAIGNWQEAIKVLTDWTGLDCGRRETGDHTVLLPIAGQMATLTPLGILLVEHTENQRQSTPGVISS
jgi:hypothetical protein